MEAQLKSLETKLEQLVKLCQQLRAENHQLRQEIATALNANRRLEDKVGGATARLEALLQQLPEDAT
jgi:cell division protein ZapB